MAYTRMGLILMKKSEPLNLCTTELVWINCQHLLNLSLLSSVSFPQLFGLVPSSSL